MREKFMKVGKIVSGVVCTAIGLAIAGFGVTQFIPSKKYISGTLPQKEDEQFFNFDAAKQISNESETD